MDTRAKRKRKKERTEKWRKFKFFDTVNRQLDSIQDEEQQTKRGKRVEEWGRENTNGGRKKGRKKQENPRKTKERLKNRISGSE